MKPITPLLFAGLLAAVQTEAQVRAPLQLMLDEAIRRGLETSHRLAEMVARGQGAEAAVGQSRALKLPVIAAQAGYLRTNHVDVFGLPVTGNQVRVIYPDIPDNYRARLDLHWPIFTSGRLDALERAARAEASAASEDVAAARGDLRLEITRAYWAVVTAAQSERVIDASVASVDAHLEAVRNQFAAGLVPPNDVLNVEAQRSRQRMLQVQARTAREVAEADLARLVGVDPGTPLQPTATLTLPQVPETAVGELVDSAGRQRPERAALVRRAAAADERIAAAATGLKPSVGLGAGIDYARPNLRIFPRVDEWRHSWDVSVNVNWPLVDGGKSRAEVA
jgi:outer membrane protein TolC